MACERWKQANPKLKPEIVPGEHFVMFSNLPSDRATSTIKVMETQYGHLKKLLGSPADRLGRKSEPLCLLQSERLHRVCPNGRVARSRCRRSVVREVVDPATVPGGRRSGGGQERGTGGREAEGAVETRRGSDAESGGADRTLAGVLTEALGTGVVASSGNAPRWLAEGIGSYLAAQVEPRSPYYRQLRQTAFANFDQGWKTKASEALGGGDQITADGVHAIGFALVEAMMSEMRQGFPAFVNGMLQGGDKLDEVLQEVYGGTREEFLDGTGDWVASHYGRLQ